VTTAGRRMVFVLVVKRSLLVRCGTELEGFAHQKL